MAGCSNDKSGGMATANDETIIIDEDIDGNAVHDDGTDIRNPYDKLPLPSEGYPRLGVKDTTYIHGDKDFRAISYLMPDYTDTIPYTLLDTIVDPHHFYVGCNAVIEISKGMGGRDLYERHIVKKSDFAPFFAKYRAKVDNYPINYFKYKETVGDTLIYDIFLSYPDSDDGWEFVLKYINGKVLIDWNYDLTYNPDADYEFEQEWKSMYHSDGR